MSEVVCASCRRSVAIDGPGVANDFGGDPQWVAFVEDLRWSPHEIRHPACFADEQGVGRLVELVHSHDVMQRLESARHRETIHGMKAEATTSPAPASTRPPVAAVRGKVLAHIRAVIGDGEQVLAAEVAQLKVGAAGLEAMDVVFMPPSVWVVVTDDRLLMFESTTGFGGRQKPGDLLFGQPLGSLAMQEEDGLLCGITLTQRRTGAVAAQLNFGLRKGARRAVLEAAGTSPSDSSPAP